MKIFKPIIDVWRFYVNGFKGLTKDSKKLWLIIFVKLFVMFAVLKVFFFPNWKKEQAKEQNIPIQEVVPEDLINRAPSLSVDTLNSK